MPPFQISVLLLIGLALLSVNVPELIVVVPRVGVGPIEDHQGVVGCLRSNHQAAGSAGHQTRQYGLRTRCRVHVVDLAVESYGSAARAGSARKRQGVDVEVDGRERAAGADRQQGASSERSKWTRRRR